MPKLVDPAQRKTTILATRLNQYDIEKVRYILEYHQALPSDLVRFLVRKEYNRLQALLRTKPHRKPPKRKASRRRA